MQNSFLSDKYRVFSKKLYSEIYRHCKYPTGAAVAVFDNMTWCTGRCLEVRGCALHLGWDNF